MIAFTINVNLYRTFYQTNWGYRYNSQLKYRTIGHLSLEHVDWGGTGDIPAVSTSVDDRFGRGNRSLRSSMDLNVLFDFFFGPSSSSLYTLRGGVESRIISQKGKEEEEELYNHITIYINTIQIYKNHSTNQGYVNQTCRRAR